MKYILYVIALFGLALKDTACYGWKRPIIRLTKMYWSASNSDYWVRVWAPDPESEDHYSTVGVYHCGGPRRGELNTLRRVLGLEELIFHRGEYYPTNSPTKVPCYCKR
jgi:hypothetical protein